MAVESMFEGTSKVKDPHTRKEVDRDQFILDATLCNYYQHPADHEAIGFMMSLLRADTNEGQIVLDPACG